MPYICGTIKEQVKNIYDSKIVDTDLLKIGINNGYQQVILGPKAYISTITVGYVPNKEFYSLIGTTYFTQLDIENKVLAGANRIYAERYLSYGVFSYEPCVTVSAFSKDIEKKGSFSADILGNYASTVSYRNNADDEYAYRFASGYVSSYLESLVLEEYTGVQAGKTIRFSHDPRNFTGTSLYNEWEYLKNKYGYIDLLPVGDFWYGIR